MQMTKVRIRATGQVIDMVPDVARAMINGGTAEELKNPVVESQAVTGGAERAVAAAHTSERKPARARR